VLFLVLLGSMTRGTDITNASTFQVSLPCTGAQAEGSVVGIIGIGRRKFMSDIGWG
jgi:hypothetical protein